MTIVDAARAEAIVRHLLTPPYPADPYPLYHELKSIAPVFPSEAGMWVCTSFEACSLVLRSPAFGQGEAAQRVRSDPRSEWSRRSGRSAG